MTKLAANIEAILLVANRPLTHRELAGFCNASAEDVQQAVVALASAYEQRRESGILLARVGNQVQMVSSGDCAVAVQKFLKQETTGELTRPQLETLTIIAYRGPVTRAELDQIRGVNCSIILRHLQVRGLIEAQADRQAEVQRYAVSLEFLKHLGFAAVDQLPDYQRLHGLDIINRLLGTTQG